MLLPGEFPPDIRVAKEADALTTAGHDITLVCRGTDAPAREVVDGITVRRIPETTPAAGPRGVADGVRYALSTVNPAFERALSTLIDRQDVDAFHVHDLPLVKTALRVGDRAGVPVVADLHENYPEAVREWQRGLDWRDPTTPLRRVFRSPCRLKRLERWCVRRVDRVVTVCEEARAHYLRDCGADPTRVAVVSNTVDRDAFDTSATAGGLGVGFDPTEAFVVSYVGTFGPHRGLETSIEAVAATEDARFLLVGAGSEAYTTAIETRAHDRLGDRVTTPGWVPFETVPGYVAASDVCVIPHRRTGHTDTTVPHKLFHAMAMAKPVVVTDVPPLRRVVESERCGVVVPAGDHAAMAEAFGALATDPDRARRLGANGREAVERRYNWGHDATRLRAVYRELDPAAGAECRTGTSP